MSEQRFSAGHVFFKTGDAADCAYHLHEGQVELQAESNGAASTRLLSPGALFGEMALIEERPRSFSARAVIAGRVTPMTRDEFERCLMQDPARVRPYLRTLFERLRSLAEASVDDPQSLPTTQTESKLTSPAPVPSASPIALPTSRGTTSHWVVVIHPLTHKAAESLPNEGLLVSRFPLRIGRASGTREPEALDLNDLWLLDQKPYHISRNHCEIQLDAEGAVVRDRGSHLGCLVNEKPIGGRAAIDSARLNTGENVLVVGSRMSRYQFRVTVSPSVDA